LIKVIRSNKGFSLIEVLIGMIFLAIGLLAIAGMQATSVRGNFNSNNLMLATYSAQDGLESLKSVPLTSPKLTLGITHSDPTTQVSTDSFKSLVFNRSYTVTSVTDPHGNYLSINYVVTWNDGVSHRLLFSTIRSE
jgi:prepilin-type N-terminal cleavage/methylation domain-containing protein